MHTPNLLFLYTDQQRYDTLACYGNDRLAMPNLNRLAETATVVEQTYVTQPVCTPSRSSLLTGLTPHTSGMTHNNVPLRDEVRCLPEMLADEYACAHNGKWHLGDEIFSQHGFHEWVSTDDGYHGGYRPERDQAARSTYHHFLAGHGLAPRNGVRFTREEIARLPEALCRPAFQAQEASRFIREHRDHPWALYVNFLEPHMPYFSCRDAQYAPADVTLPPNCMHPLDEQYSRRARREAERFRTQGFEIDPPLNSEARWRALTARYWGMCSLVDTYIGQMLDTLAACGLEEDTIVVFTSDHGDLLSSHNILGKSLMFEEATRVPLLIRLPGQRAQRRVSGPVSQLDIVPTLLEAMGQPLPAHLEGASRLNLIADGGTAAADVFIEWHGRRAAAASDPVPGECLRTVVTTDGWKLNVSSIGDHELFHVAEDPCEYRNRIGDPAQRDRVADLLGRIAAWQCRTQDTLMPLPDIDAVTGAGKGLTRA